MTDHDFQAKVLEGLAELKTDMKRLVGPDGNGGVIKEQDERLDKLERAKARQGGYIAAWGTFCTIGLSIFEYFAHKR